MLPSCDSLAAVQHGAAMMVRGLAIRGDLDAAALRRFAQTEPDRRAALRAIAIAQALEGASRTEAASVIGRERQSLRDAVVRYNAEGLAGLRDRLRSGRREKLNAEQQATLRAWVLQGPDPDVDGVSSYRLLDIVAHIEACWGVCYTLSALARLLHRMGLSWQKARPAHPKGSAEARELYKKTSPPSWRQLRLPILTSRSRSGVKTKPARVRRAALAAAGSLAASAHQGGATSASSRPTSSLPFALAATTRLLSCCPRRRL